MVLMWGVCNVDELSGLDNGLVKTAPKKLDTKMVSLLLDNGARDDVVSEFGKTASQAAQSRGDPMQETFAKAKRRKR